jgi:hypothetical protein
LFARSEVDLDLFTGDAVFVRDAYGLGPCISRGDAKMFAGKAFALGAVRSAGETFSRGRGNLDSDISRGGARIFECDGFGIGPGLSRGHTVFAYGGICLWPDVSAGDAVVFASTEFGLVSIFPREEVEVFSLNGFRLGAKTSSGDSVSTIGSAVILGGGPMVLIAEFVEDFSFASFAGGGGGSCPVLIVKSGLFRRECSFAGGLFPFCDSLCSC